MPVVPPSAGTPRSPAERASHVIDWRRQREVLQALRTTGRAEWRPFDWDADDWDSDIVPLRHEPFRCTATPVVLLEGAYSARPELHDLLDLRVLLHTPTDLRLRRLLERRVTVSRRLVRAVDRRRGPLLRRRDASGAVRRRTGAAR